MEWLSAIIILVYAGAIAILFIISLMIVNPSVIEEPLTLSSIFKKPFILQSFYIIIFTVTVYNIVKNNNNNNSFLNKEWNENILNIQEIEVIGNFLFSIESIGLILGLIILLLPIIGVLVFVF
jgi:NADH:ubiquinone oxidoreductase subunit 6 (subunit J)